MRRDKGRLSQALVTEDLALAEACHRPHSPTPRSQTAGSLLHARRSPASADATQQLAASTGLLNRAAVRSDSLPVTRWRADSAAAGRSPTGILNSASDVIFCPYVERSTILVAILKLVKRRAVPSKAT